MPQAITPMIHVPDVRATAEWYASVLGFELTGEHVDCGEMLWTRLRYNGSEIMLNVGGQPSAAHRREFDLYITIENLDLLFEQMKGLVDVFEAPHDTEYGMREFIIRDCNRFWITFGEPL